MNDDSLSPPEVPHAFETPPVVILGSVDFVEPAREAPPEEEETRADPAESAAEPNEARAEIDGE